MTDWVMNEWMAGWLVVGGGWLVVDWCSPKFECQTWRKFGSFQKQIH